MEIVWDEKTLPAYRDLMRSVKSTQMTMESVVPDTKDDIGRILSVRPEIYLKNKEWRGRGVSVDAEVQLCVLYVNEAENAVQSFRAAQGLSFDYEINAQPEEDCRLQASFGEVRVQTRVLNPRKACFDLELSCELILSARTQIVTQQEAPAGLTIPLHLLVEEHEAELLTSVCEKSLSLSEQLAFPEGAPVPAAVILTEKRWQIREKTVLGSRLLVKGELCLTAYYEPEAAGIPQSAAFQVPFSLLVELEDEESAASALRIEAISEHTELVDSIEGKKLLDFELRVLVQVRATRRTVFRFVADAYSNAMPGECRREEYALPNAPEERLVLEGEALAELPDGSEEPLLVFASLGPCEDGQGSCTVELLTRGAEGRLGVARRSVSLHAPSERRHTEKALCRLVGLSAEKEGAGLTLRAAAEGLAPCEAKRIVSRVSGVILDEDAAFDRSAFPALTAVWAETETLWELAKLYHSDVESIRALNAEGAPGPVMIPKTP